MGFTGSRRYLGGGGGGGGGSSSILVSVTSFPSSPSTGDVVYHRTAQSLYRYTGSLWVPASPGVAAFTGGTGMATGLVAMLDPSTGEAIPGNCTVRDETLGWCDFGIGGGRYQVRREGVITTTGLTAGAWYFMGESGALVDSANIPAGAGEVPVGVALTTTQLQLSLEGGGIIVVG